MSSRPGDVFCPYCWKLLRDTNPPCSTFSSYEKVRHFSIIKIRTVLVLTRPTLNIISIISLTIREHNTWLSSALIVTGRKTNRVFLIIKTLNYFFRLNHGNHFYWIANTIDDVNTKLGKREVHPVLSHATILNQRVGNQAYKEVIRSLME